MSAEFKVKMSAEFFRATEDLRAALANFDRIKKRDLSSDLTIMDQLNSNVDAGIRIRFYNELLIKPYRMMADTEVEDFKNRLNEAVGTRLTEAQKERFQQMKPDEAFRLRTVIEATKKNLRGKVMEAAMKLAERRGVEEDLFEVANCVEIINKRIVKQEKKNRATVLAGILFSDPTMMNQLKSNLDSGIRIVSGEDRSLAWNLGKLFHDFLDAYVQGHYYLYIHVNDNKRVDSLLLSSRRVKIMGPNGNIGGVSWQVYNHVFNVSLHAFCYIEVASFPTQASLAHLTIKESKASKEKFKDQKQKGKKNADDAWRANHLRHSGSNEQGEESKDSDNLFCKYEYEELKKDGFNMRNGINNLFFFSLTLFRLLVNFEESLYQFDANAKNVYVAVSAPEEVDKSCTIEPAEISTNHDPNNVKAKEETRWRCENNDSAIDFGERRDVEVSQPLVVGQSPKIKIMTFAPHTKDVDARIGRLKTQLMTELAECASNAPLGHGLVNDFLISTLYFCLGCREHQMKPIEQFNTSEKTVLERNLKLALPRFESNISAQFNPLGSESAMRFRQLRSALQFLKDDIVEEQSEAAVKVEMEKLLGSTFLADVDEDLDDWKERHELGEWCTLSSPSVDLRFMPESHHWWLEEQRDYSKKHFEPPTDLLL